MADENEKVGRVEPPNDWVTADSIPDEVREEPREVRREARREVPRRMQSSDLPPHRGLVPHGRAKLDGHDVVAIVINFIFPGVGQMILGQPMKGLVMLIASFMTCGGLGFLWLVAVVDAYLCALAAKHRPLEDWEFFPDWENLWKK